MSIKICQDQLREPVFAVSGLRGHSASRLRNDIRIDCWFAILVPVTWALLYHTQRDEPSCGQQGAGRESESGICLKPQTCRWLLAKYGPVELYDPKRGHQGYMWETPGFPGNDHLSEADIKAAKMNQPGIIWIVTCWMLLITIDRNTM